MTIRTTIRTTIRKNGTVRVWDVYRQQWLVTSAAQLAANASLMATLPESDRVRIERAAALA